MKNQFLFQVGKRGNLSWEKDISTVNQSEGQIRETSVLVDNLKQGYGIFIIFSKVLKSKNFQTKLRAHSHVKHVQFPKKALTYLAIKKINSKSLSIQLAYIFTNFLQRNYWKSPYVMYNEQVASGYSIC